MGLDERMELVGRRGRGGDERVGVGRIVGDWIGMRVGVDA
jgi:hypothetical protein